MPSVYAHLPAPRFHEFARQFAALGVGVELYLPAVWLDTAAAAELESIARTGGGLKLDFIVHAPFMNLDLGADDPDILAVSRRRLRQAADIARRLNATSLVCHSGYVPFATEKIEDKWLATQVDSWRELLAYAPEFLSVNLENIREWTPRPLLEILALVASPRLRICWDFGHFNLFGRLGYREWAAAVAPFLGELHLHNNHGGDDDHLSLDDGTAPVPAMLEELVRLGARPLLTLEHYDEARLRRSLAVLEPFLPRLRRP